LSKYLNWRKGDNLPGIEDDLASQAFARLLILKIVNGITRFIFGKLADKSVIFTSLGSVLNNDFPVIVCIDANKK
jgi:hypothetical protein